MPQRLIQSLLFSAAIGLLWGSCWAAEVTTEATGVLFVHGLYGSSANWDRMRAELNLARFGTVEQAIDFTTAPETQSNEASIRSHALALSAKIKSMLARGDINSVKLVCHSMGGLAARWYLHHPALWPAQSDGAPSSGVSALIMLGTPNWGTDVSVLNPILGLGQAYAADGSNAVDKLDHWPPAIIDLFSEWMPAPQNGGGYPRGFKLDKWKHRAGIYSSPILAPATYTLSLPDPFGEIAAAKQMFPMLDVSKRSQNHILYYQSHAAAMGPCTCPPSGAGISGVDYRRISQFLYDLNIASADSSQARVYIIAGDKSASFSAIKGPFVRKNDGVVPVDSVMGCDPLNRKGPGIFSSAVVRKTMHLSHSELLTDSKAIAQVLKWLRQ